MPENGLSFFESSTLTADPSLYASPSTTISDTPAGGFNKIKVKDLTAFVTKRK